MQLRLSLLILLSCCVLLTQEKRKELPAPKVVSPGAQPSLPPADATILFEGRDLSQWTRINGEPTGCKSFDGIMSCTTGAGDAVSKPKFRNAQIHLEYNLPSMPKQNGQLRANSGVFLQGCYELQILDSLNNPTYADGIAGALYGFAPPLVNASLPAEQWQSYDILFTAPKCDSKGEVESGAMATVIHNGVAVQYNTPMPKKGAGCRQQNVCEAGPIILQDHSGFPGAPKTEMRFRNIWLRNLN
jgi:hypothetical protein